MRIDYIEWLSARLQYQLPAKLHFFFALCMLISCSSAKCLNLCVCDLVMPYGVSNFGQRWFKFRNSAIMRNQNMNKFMRYLISDQTCHASFRRWFYMMTSSSGNISAILAICVVNSPVPGEFPTQRPVTRSFDVFFDLRLNQRFSKQS